MSNRKQNQYTKRTAANSRPTARLRDWAGSLSIYALAGGVQGRGYG